MLHADLLGVPALWVAGYVRGLLAEDHAVRLQEEERERVRRADELRQDAQLRERYADELADEAKIATLLQQERDWIATERDASWTRTYAVMIDTDRTRMDEEIRLRADLDERNLRVGKELSKASKRQEQRQTLSSTDDSWQHTMREAEVSEALKQALNRADLQRAEEHSIERTQARTEETSRRMQEQRQEQQRQAQQRQVQQGLDPGISL
jgi:hypothetical protein